MAERATEADHVTPSCKSRPLNGRSYLGYPNSEQVTHRDGFEAPITAPPPTHGLQRRIGNYDLLDPVRKVKVELLVCLVVRRHNLNHNRSAENPHITRRATM